MIHCPICGAAARVFHKLIKHLKLYHEQTAGFTITCHLPGCKNEYSKVNSYARHVERAHANHDIFAENCSEPDEVCRNLLPQFENATSNDTAFADEESTSDKAFNSNPRTLLELVDRADDYLTKFILRLREKHILPLTFSDKIASNVNAL